MKHHGMSGHPLYCTWVGMMNRCYKKTHDSYPNYGERGISVCARWKNPRNFISDMAPKPSAKHTVDRKDNDGVQPRQLQMVNEARTSKE